MSVLLETSLGDLVVDLEVEECPRSCENFLKLCKAYKYNYLTFFSVQKNFLAQTGDPSNTGAGGSSIWSQLDPSSSAHARTPYFRPERHRTFKHTVKGTLSMACNAVGDEEDEEVVAGSQFFITLADNIEYLDGKHAPFGRVVEGAEEGGTLEKMNSAFVDKDMRPLRDIRIQHVVVLDDPFEDPPGLMLPSRTPSPTPGQLAAIGLDASAPMDDTQERPAEEVEEERRKADTTAAALTLEMVGDLPFAEVRPPENILFVCKLNPITRSEDLDLIFSRFGKILSCEVIKDKKTGDSLQYAFIEFDKQEAAEQVSALLMPMARLIRADSGLHSYGQAYFKMQNVLIDDRRIWIDFSQSVSKLSTSWNSSRSGGKPVRVMGGGNTQPVDQGLVFDFAMHRRRDEQGSSDRRNRDERQASHRTVDRREGHQYDDGRSDRRRYDHDDRRDRSRYDDYERRRSEGRRDERDYDRRDHRYKDDRTDRRRPPPPSSRERSPARRGHVY